MRIGPYTTIPAIGFMLCNIFLPLDDGVSTAKFWHVLALPPIWGVCFTVAYAKSLRKAGMSLVTSVAMNAILALPFVVLSYWAGRLA